MRLPFHCANNVFLLILLLSLASVGSSASIPFTRPFAPQDGLVAPVEKANRAEICLNGSWEFSPAALPADFKQGSGNAPQLPDPKTAIWEKTKIRIPSPWNVNAFNVGAGGDFRDYPSYPASWNNVQMGWLRKSFNVPNSWQGKRLFLRFNAIAGQAVVYVNGRQVGENFDLFLPAQYDVTDYVKLGGANELLVGVRKASLFDSPQRTGPRPYPGGSMWGEAIVGIWQDVFLEAMPSVHVSDTYIISKVSKGILSSEVTLQNDTGAAKTVRIGADVRPWINLASSSVLDAPAPHWKLGEKVLNFAQQVVTIPAGQALKVTLNQPVGKSLSLWSPETPHLYGLVVSVYDGAKQIDCKYTRFGYREFTFDGNHQLLNGKRLELRGDSWHFLGVPQLTRRYAWAWYKALKDAHGNAVRLHAEPYPSFYLDVADEMGVCVLDETAIWGSDLGHKYDSPDFWTRCDDHVRRLVLRDRNHASVFGWSLSNEVSWYLQDKQPDLMDRLKQGWRDWLNIARTLDPSRPWVSSDGDQDARGIMPTAIYHYNDPKDIVRADKPFGEGEAGGGYCATPNYAAQFVGPRAYESQQGRMEGLAIEAYGIIKGQRSVGSSYCSVFNLVWYGLKPLELGLSDTTRPYTMNDGIVFPGYKEGVPGIQPERLGPYCTTLNPGYDPHLPLYRTWPLADAMKAAYALEGPAPSPWDHVVVSPAQASTKPAKSISKIVVLADQKSLLPNELLTFGANVADVSQLDSADFIVIDGNMPPVITDELKKSIGDRVSLGATCLVSGVNKETAAKISALLPAAVEATDRLATSLVIDSPDELLAGMTDANLYFTETVNYPVIKHGLDGPFVKSGRVILSACPTEWKQWNDNPEPIKTAAVYRSEREAKPAGVALVEKTQGAGRYLVSTIDITSPATDILHFATKFMTNAGVEFKEETGETTDAIDMLGRLSKALVCGSFGESSADELYRTDHIGVNDQLRPKVGDKSGAASWSAAKIGSDASFNFKNLNLQGPTENADVYLSFWVWSPRPLDNILAAPNVPQLDLMMGSDDGCQVWLNSHLIKEERAEHPVTADSIVAENLPLQRGWNHFVVKVVQIGGDWGFMARFRCSDAKFLLSLKSSITPPAD
jgi:beta-galactosidase